MIVRHSSSEEVTQPREVSCETIDYLQWEVAGVHTTCIVNTASIDVKEFTFASRIENITGLDFDANKKVEYLPIFIHEKFPNLEALSAYDCSIKEISKESFKELNKLKVLWLSGNQIQKIESDVFKDLTLLEIVDLSLNQISSMKGDSFEGLKHLKAVGLKGNMCINQLFIGEDQLSTVDGIVTAKCAEAATSIVT
ncbi:CLUMA_CG016747, isoform A [Clunio marinus]|uniref:CLUMA_CG016747, isoform A n=1 Tax=Clunio marinus TaxID=568069 RepID=A0A1J1IUG4_9DIPT|nr:CLUMA_CG016747, isoform A [Clunio marinus]